MNEHDEVAAESTQLILHPSGGAAAWCRNNAGTTVKMKCDMMATAAILLVLLAYHPIGATGIAIVGGSIPHTICPGRGSGVAGKSSSLLCPQDHPPAATETPLTTTKTTTGGEEDSVELVARLKSGHDIRVSKPKTATEEDVRSLSLAL